MQRERLTHLSELTLLTPNKVRLTTMKERKMADQTTCERGERNWKIQRRCSGLRMTTVVPLVMKGLVKSTTADRLADIWKGAMATSAFWGQETDRWGMTSSHGHVGFLGTGNRPFGA